jgi:Spy/CpxP family protein refolding chaperone
MPDAAALAKQADGVGRLWTEALKERLSASVKLRELLTPEQRKKAAELRRKQPASRRAQRSGRTQKAPSE